MDFNEYLKRTLDADDELKEEYDNLQHKYEIIKSIIQILIKYNPTKK